MQNYYLVLKNKCGRSRSQMQIYSDQGTGKMGFENGNSFVALRTVLFPSNGLITCDPGLQLLSVPLCIDYESDWYIDFLMVKNKHT